MFFAIICQQKAPGLLSVMLGIVMIRCFCQEPVSVLGVRTENVFCLCSSGEKHRGHQRRTADSLDFVVIRAFIILSYTAIIIFTTATARLDIIICTS